MAEVEYFINFREQNKKFCLSLHYNGSNNFLFVNGVNIYQFKTKDFEINAYSLYLGNILENVTVHNINNWAVWICV